MDVRSSGGKGAKKGSANQLVSAPRKTDEVVVIPESQSLIERRVEKRNREAKGVLTRTTSEQHVMLRKKGVWMYMIHYEESMEYIIF